VRVAAAIALLFALVLASAPPARATPADKLDEAREKFRAGDYPSVIGIVYPLLFPDPALATEAELAEAYLMLGVSYFETDRLEESERWFEEALLLDDSIELDPNLYSPKVVNFFAKKKQALAAKLEEARREAQIAAYKATLANLRQVNVERHPFYINFLPFGAGQFQNNESGKGYFFAISEGVLGGISFATFLSLSLDFGFPTLKIPPNDPDAADRAILLQRVQVGTGIAFTALYVWGVIDSLRDYQPEVVRTTQIDPKYLPPDLQPPPGSSRFRLIPVAGPDEAGVLLRWEF